MEWRDVVGYEGIYEVSDEGGVRTHKNKTTYSVRHGVRNWRQRVLAQKISADGCHRVNLWKDRKEKTWLVHRLVALAFIEKVEGKDYVNHIDGDHYNNSVSNLEWCTHKENSNHAFDTGLMPTSKKVLVVDENDGEEFEFRSMAKASLFLGKAHGFVSGRLKANKNYYRNFKFKVLGE
ncbi:NUMOD4 domain-containing protein [Halobacillus karajensis]|uniref:Group I intron endonuclease n=1 Tax=Halobacillus karajensis TaxID=195088 RepID=A0A059NYN0_9BACI|nr:NUMOD4 domain-containing protein [Halobacillus karajensis]CDQ22597.1 group I intron endonuclease [Halobacillus karajensis]CDQ26079.1 group I intron endonuclease [Halobacillus karajensis]